MKSSLLVVFMAVAMSTVSAMDEPSLGDEFTSEKNVFSLNTNGNDAAGLGLGYGYPGEAPIAQQQLLNQHVLQNGQQAQQRGEEADNIRVSTRELYSSHLDDIHKKLDRIIAKIGAK